jgi:hypothetical protein
VKTYRATLYHAGYDINLRVRGNDERAALKEVERWMAHGHYRFRLRELVEVSEPSFQMLLVPAAD